MIVDQAIYRDGLRHTCGDLSDELDVLRSQHEGFLWIGLKDPTEEEFDLVNDELQLHPLAVEDAVKLIVSAGLVGPDQQQEQLRRLAKNKSAKPVPEEEPVI